MIENTNIQIIGHLTITDVESGEVVVDKKNAIHPQNMATVIARALARDNNGYVYKLCLGNGGTFYNSSKQIVYRPPNVIGEADLYNLTYEIQVDDQTAGTPSSNSVVSTPSPPPSITSLVSVTALLSANEPAGQATADNETTDPSAPYVFNEAGLKTSDGLLLTHLVFNPYEKTGNRAYKIVYDLTISVS